MKDFNLSDWALHHRSMIWFLMLVACVAGTFSYLNLGREEDPNFTIKTMVVSGSMPGATVEEMSRQVTDRIEKKLQDLDSLDYTRSITTPGQTVVFVNLLPTTPAPQVRGIWTKVRHMMADIRSQFPSEFQGFSFNDDYGDVYGNIYAFTSDGISQRQLRADVEDVRTQILQLPEAGKIQVIGEQDETIYLEFSLRQIAGLGLDQQAILNTLQAQNAIAPSGVIQSGPERILVRVSGQYSSEASLTGINLRVNDRFFRLTDVAKIVRGYTDPPKSLFRYNGQPAIGLAIGMRTGGNILDFGKALNQDMKRIVSQLPVGVGVHQVADQSTVVDEAVGGFTKALFEAVAIVLAVSFVSLGFRAGFVVTLSIPLVLAMTFMGMEIAGIDLQRISLGALIIALGLLVDDAMIAIETMVSRLEMGESKEKAASFAWTSIAFPMLTGTLVTVAGFLPIGFNNSNAGEYTFSLFVVIAMSLLLSWIVAVLFTPLIGVKVLPKTMHRHDAKPGVVRRAFSGVLKAAMRFRWITILVTVAIFAGSIVGMKFVQQQFFPTSDRPELIVDFNLRHNASIEDTKTQMDKLEAALKGDTDIDHWSSYVGQSAERFILSYDVQPSNPFFGQFVIVNKDIEARERVKKKIEAFARKHLVGIDVFVKYLELGPPVGRPVQYRVGGPNLQVVRDKARELAGVIGQDPRLTSIVMDWNEPARVLKVQILQDKARALGITSQEIANTLNTILDGTTVTQVIDGIYLVPIIARGDKRDRNSIEAIENLQLTNSKGQSIPLASLVNFDYTYEDPILYSRSRIPTITIKAAINGPTQPATIVDDLKPKVAAFEKTLPEDYTVAIGGAVESSEESQGPIAAVVPVMVLVMLTLIMVQMQSFRAMFVVLCAAPLGLIGVVAALVPSGAPLGFVAILGVLALVGILIRNSIILVHQVDVLREEGMHPWLAVFEASEMRARPILLTAAAASLALIPISREVFWGPMAYAMMGGIIAGTLITLLFIPALYLAVFRVKEPDDREMPLTGHAPSHPGAGGSHPSDEDAADGSPAPA
ncbi:efflux RND transporter permease subunit [Jiella sp. MQZ9-1]|uniref:Efflux RND transporter permease subunit n=1 Tax=Jiella flava TaxID=2816857 RepID=A0A939FX24_9HYPH|nr:efflux RND transporter permease subunit [Jiella flava]MBO0661082.1 efflux RND transporter permease subunit [Jiella flava]MCD2469729.1 efflux RND transporter permease subunit [Jiella flava]